MPTTGDRMPMLPRDTPARQSDPSYGSLSSTDDAETENIVHSPNPNRWEYVIAFPDPPKVVAASEQDTREAIVKRLRSTGLETKLFPSDFGNIIYCELRADDKVLRKAAESMKLHMLLDANVLRKTAEEGLPSYGIGPFPITDVKDQYKYDPYEYIYAPYWQGHEFQHLYAQKGRNGSVFDGTERLIIIQHLIENKQTGAACDVDRLKYEGVIIDAYPLHDQHSVSTLKRQWLSWRPRPMSQPFDLISTYFGEKVALYFVYLGHYSKWLRYPASAGIFVGLLQLYLRYRGETAALEVISPLFGAAMLIWMTLYLEDWKRENHRQCMRWGTLNFTQVVQLRPEFQGETIDSPIDGRPTRYFPPREKLKRVAYSYVVISVLILIVFALVSSIFVLRYDLTKGNDSSALVVYSIQLGPAMAALANVVQITIMTKIYDYVSIHLNDQENHRTDVQYENSLIVKTVIFQFVNNYAGLFYVAFLKNDIEGCDLACTTELEFMLAIVYLSRMAVGNLNEVAIPRILTYFTHYQLTGHLRTPPSAEREDRESKAEDELFLAEYGWRGTFDDFAEIVITFGFTVFFIAIFPFAPVLALVYNYLELRLDAYRLLYENRRPRPHFAKDMGYWYKVLQAFSAIAVCTNGGVIVFTGDLFTHLSPDERVWVFTAFVGVIFFIKYLLEVTISDTPTSVQAQKARETFLVNKVLYHVHEDGYSSRQPSAGRVENPELVLTMQESDGGNN